MRTAGALLVVASIIFAASVWSTKKTYRHHAYWCLTPNIGYPMGLPCRYARNPEKSI